MKVAKYHKPWVSVFKPLHFPRAEDYTNTAVHKRLWPLI